MTMPAAPSKPVADLLGRFDFHTLLSGAAHLRPDHTALADMSAGALDPMSFREFDRRAHGLANALRDMGLRPQERVLLQVRASSNAVVTLIAALRAGLDVVLAPIHLGTGEVGSVARQSGAVALVGEARSGEEAAIENLFSVAALASDVRMVCSVGDIEIDGAAPLDPRALAHDATEMRPTTAAAIFTVAQNGAVIEHRQSTLVAATLDFAARARIGSDSPLLTCFAPTTFGGLVTGPLASLLTGASLMFAPCPTADSLLSAIAMLQPLNAILPAALAQALDQSGLTDRSRLETLVLLHRRETMDEAAHTLTPFARNARRARVLDLYAIAEHAAVAEPRDAHGAPVAPATEPHMIALDNQSTLAVRRSAYGDWLEGCAVTSQRQSA